MGKFRAGKERQALINLKILKRLPTNTGGKTYRGRTLKKAKEWPREISCTLKVLRKDFF